MRIGASKSARATYRILISVKIRIIAILVSSAEKDPGPGTLANHKQFGYTLQLILRKSKNL